MQDPKRILQVGMAMGYNYQNRGRRWANKSEASTFPRERDTLEAAMTAVQARGATWAGHGAAAFRIPPRSQALLTGEDTTSVDLRL